MPTDHRAALRNIRTFPALIRYLRDEMDWPISVEDFEDLTFEYTPEELGIDADSAAKIVEIKRLRPLTSGQPWGVFFVKFEPKKLPVVALRRILSRVALKKRASANSAERTAWAMDDLLFISNYGEGDERQISFAHFSQPEAKTDLPTLKVLGWDGLDTPLHLDAVADKLTQNLAWPDDPEDADAWRAGWRTAFSLRYREVITTSRDLSIHLAELARSIRDRIRTALAIETERGPLTKLMGAFREALVHDLDADGFADMYAQTIAYGLLSARIANPTGDTADELATQMPVTNPFLKELMETFLRVGGRHGKAGGPGIDFDELGVSDVVELLDHANMDAVIRDFGDQNPQEDPVIHFYELFLKDYDAKKRMQRGVFYTPRPVVSYIVRSVDELLRTEFGLEDGLADISTWGEMATRHGDLQIPEGTSPDQDFIQILDPACGTGTFLVEVIDLVHKTLVAKWKAQGHNESRVEVLWNEYVPKHLLPRLHGYELLMAPYAIAHVKIGLKLYETGYRFGSDERVRIYLTNALEPVSDNKKQIEFSEWVPALAHEAKAVNEVKRNQQFTVLIGNPPYAGHSQNNQIPWIVDEVHAYKRGYPSLQKPGQAKWLQDDYVKFFRFAEVVLSASPIALLGFITNHSFLDNPTFVGMRNSLMQTFRGIQVLNLNGNGNERLVAPDGGRDENVFDIQQGVSITIGIRGVRQNSEIQYLDLFGPREAKYANLLKPDSIGTAFIPVLPEPPHFAFRPSGSVSRAEFEAGYSVPFLMNQLGDPAAGVVTTHDEFAIAWTSAEAREKVHRLLATKSEAEARTLFRLCSQTQWNYERAKAELADGAWIKDVRPVLYHPFDIRWTVFNRHVAVHRRQRIMKHMLAGQNVGLITVRNIPPGATAPYALATRQIIVNGAIRPSGSPSIDTLFPLYMFSDGGDLALGAIGPTPNLNPTVAADIAACAHLQYVPVGRGNLETTIGPTDIFNYLYACLYSSSYRVRYASFLESEFPSILFAADRALLASLSSMGGELVSLHVMESPKLDHSMTTYTGPKHSEVGRVGWSDDTVWLDAAATRRGQPATPGTVGFRGVPEEVWNFHIGGYQVCEKWLKDRKGRTLSDDDVAHYQKIVVALAETIRLMQEIDEVIEQHGGWPGAFAGETGLAKSGAMDSTSESDVLPLSIPRCPRPVYQPDSLPLAKVAEPDAPHYGADRQNELAPRASVGDLAREELMCEIRHMFSDGADREREDAINSLAREVGFKRTGSRIHEELDNALRTAVRRGILSSERGTLQLFAQSIDQYDRDFLKGQFLASLDGHRRTERDDAIRAFARWMGFRRTGSSIDGTVRSLINGLLREDRLESAGSQIRRSG